MLGSSRYTFLTCDFAKLTDVYGTGFAGSYHYGSPSTRVLEELASWGDERTIEGYAYWEAQTRSQRGRKLRGFSSNRQLSKAHKRVTLFTNIPTCYLYVTRNVWKQFRVLTTKGDKELTEAVASCGKEYCRVSRLFWEVFARANIYVFCNREDSTRLWKNFVHEFILRGDWKNLAILWTLTFECIGDFDGAFKDTIKYEDPHVGRTKKCLTGCFKQPFDAFELIYTYLCIKISSGTIKIPLQCPDVELIPNTL